MITYLIKKKCELIIKNITKLILLFSFIAICATIALGVDVYIGSFSSAQWNVVVNGGDVDPVPDMLWFTFDNTPTNLIYDTSGAYSALVQWIGFESDPKWSNDYPIATEPSVLFNQSVISNSTVQLGNFATSFTAMVWFKTSQSPPGGQYPVFIGKGTWALTERWTIGLNGDDSGHLFARASPGAVLDGGVVNNGAWHHAAITHVPGVTDYLYLDGLQVDSDTATSTVISNGTAITMGNLQPELYSRCIGKIAMPTIYAYNLSSQQVYNTYASNSYAANVLAQWRFTNDATRVVSRITNSGNLDVRAFIPAYAPWPIVTNGWIEFNGLNYGQIDWVPTQFSTQFTFSTWYYTDQPWSNIPSATMTEFMLSYGQSGTVLRTQYSINRGQGSNSKTNSFLSWGGTTNHDDSGGETCFNSAHVGTWIHLLTTHDASANPKDKYYLNGTLLSTYRTNFVLPYPHDFAWIGRKMNGDAAAGVIGRLDDMRVYGRVLSASEIGIVSTTRK
jgi:hypothetical protein